MLMDQAGGLFVNQGRKGVKWAINLDKYSGFVRQIVGGLSRSEQKRIGQIRKFHGGLANARPVRIFPRRVDARLLGGLSHLIGKPYRSLKVVRANYELRGGQVAIVNLSADGRRKSGRILLDPVARSCPVPRSVNNDP